MNHIDKKQLVVKFILPFLLIIILLSYYRDTLESAYWEFVITLSLFFIFGLIWILKNQDQIVKFQSQKKAKQAQFFLKTGAQLFWYSVKIILLATLTYTLVSLLSIIIIIIIFK